MKHFGRTALLPMLVGSWFIATSARANTDEPSLSALQYIATQSYVYTALSLSQGLNAASQLGISSDDRIAIFHLRHGDREVQAARREIIKLRASHPNLGQNPDLIQAESSLTQAHVINQKLEVEVSHLRKIEALSSEQLKSLQEAFRSLLRASPAVGTKPLPPPGDAIYHKEVP